MSVLTQYQGTVPSGVIIDITSAPEGETELIPGAWVEVAGVDDAGSVNVRLHEGRGEWRVFDPAEFRWRFVPQFPPELGEAIAFN